MVKQAQVTLFIVLGVIVVAIAGVFLFFNDSIDESDLQTQTPGRAEYAGQQELRNFMDACIRDAAYNGLELMRIQAGYINIPLSAPITQVQTDRKIVTENGVKKVQIEQGGITATPYWLDSNNVISIPSLGYVQNQFESYITHSVETCVNDFSSFTSQGYVIDAQDLTTSVAFSEEVLITLSYPMTVDRGDITFEESEFILRVPLNIPKALLVQGEVVQTEYQTAYLENDITYLIDLYGYAGGEKKDHHLPPLTHAEAGSSCAMITWQFSEVQEKILTNLKQNSQYFVVRGAGDIHQDPDPVKQGVYEGLAITALSQDHGNINIDFSVSEDQFVFDIQPRVGNQVRPSRHRGSGIKLLPLFCTNRYQFKYTLRFPMLTTLTLEDNPAIDLAGKKTDESSNYEFVVPIGVHLCGNQDRHCSGKNPYSEIDLDLSGLDFEPAFESTFCELDKRASRPLHITTLDAYTNEPVSDVALLYRCVSSECLIDATDDNGELISTFPLCKNGELFGIKEDYAQNIKRLTTETGEQEEDVTYLLEPLKTLDVEMQLIDVPVFLANYHLTNGYSSPDKCTGETINPSIAAAVVGDKNIIVSNTQGPATVALVYPENAQTQLSSGSYRFTFLVEGQSVIPEARFGDQVVSLNEQGGTYRGSFLFGAYNHMDASFELSDVKDATKIIFYVPVETSTNTLDLTNLGNTIQSDGSFSLEGLLDNDCDGQSDDPVTITVPHSEVVRLLAPILQ